MVHTLPVKGKSAMLNIAEQLGIRKVHRSGFRPYWTRNNSGGSSAEKPAASQCRRLDGHGPVSLTEQALNTHYPAGESRAPRLGAAPFQAGLLGRLTTSENIPAL